VKALLDQRADPTVRNNHKRTPLHTAVMATNSNKQLQQQQVACVDILLRAANDCVDVQDIDGNTPLHLAVNNANTCTDVIDALLDAGARSDIPNRKHKHVVHVAAETPNSEHSYASVGCLIRQAVNAGVDLNALDVLAQTPLLLSVRACNFQTAYALLEAGADSMKKDRLGTTPLHVLLSTEEQYRDDWWAKLTKQLKQAALIQ